MPLKEKHKYLSALAGILISSIFMGLQPQAAIAKQRYALIVAVGDYDVKNGLPALDTPVNDAQDVKIALETLPEPFAVTLLTDDKVKDKETFQTEFQRFLLRVKPDDDVLFYFSGHGYHIERKNYYLVKTAKLDTTFFKDLPPAEAKDLDTVEKKKQRYEEFIAKVGLSEEDIEKAIADQKPGAIILIVDASRSKIDTSKGAVPEPQGVILPPGSSYGTYRLYSASEGQISLDSLEPLFRPGSADYKPVAPAWGAPKVKPRRNSLFAHVLISQMRIAGLPFLVMEEQVQNKVRTQALDAFDKDQIPNYNDDRVSSDYFLWPNEGGEQPASCQFADIELEILRSGITSGSLDRDNIQQKYAELSRCGPSIRDQLWVLREVEAQGTGTFVNQVAQASDSAKPTEPQDYCDARASSALDAERPPTFAGADVQKLALSALATGRTEIAVQVKTIVDACEQAVKQRPRVARFKFNAARANYALAIMSSGLERTVALRRASLLNQEAVDLGYAAAYNNLAVMIRFGEFYRENADLPDPPNREEAAKLFTFGADLGHVVAQYNLGMAYLRGELGLGKSTNYSSGGASASKQSRQASAFKYLSAASEKSYVPAMIEAAKLLNEGKGIGENPDRAVELLEAAAYTNSWQAMYDLAEIYLNGYGKERRQDDRLAIMWYARAAEAGDVRAQRKLAIMLYEGRGIPAPQPEAAGRYFRLAADGGDEYALAKLGDLLQDRKIPFRPIADRKPDGGALEIRRLYSAAFEKGNPLAGLALGTLYRSGFPTDRGSEAIPKDPEKAADWLYRTIESVNRAEPDEWQADPETAADAAFELISMYDKGEAKRRDGSLVLTADQIQQLRQDYGDLAQKGYIRVGGIGTPLCGNKSKDLENEWVAVWDWTRDDPPTEPQLRWLERRYKCAEREITQAKEQKKPEPKPEDTGFTREFRERIAQQYRLARDDAKRNGPNAKSFYSRMAEWVINFNKWRR
jgi:TPR repeat protein